MNLLEIRTQFAKLSGRYDLVNNDFTNNGADYFLKAGLKFLDRRVEFDKDFGLHFTQKSSASYFTEVASYRTIESVWYADSADGRYELEYMAPLEFQETYGTEPYYDGDSGDPKYWTMRITREIPDGTSPDVIGNYATEILADGTQVLKQGILVAPALTNAGQLELWGKFDTAFPSLDTDTNYWFSKFEHIAINAGLFQLENSYRNTQGAKDYLAAIDIELAGIDKDTVEDDLRRAEVMNG